jgi:hypothetical protein
MWTSRFLVCLTVVLLSGCSVTGPVKVIDTGCTWMRPVYVSKKDILTDGTAQQILGNNTAGERNCNWPKAPAAAKKK